MKQKSEKDPRSQESGKAGDKSIRQLLEQAGRRPDIPTADFRSIKAAARVEWQQLVDTRRSRKSWWTMMTPLPAAAGILVVLALGIWWRAETVRPGLEAIASIELFSGDVWLEQRAEMAGAELALTEGGSLTAGMELVTSDNPEGSPSLISVRLTNGQSVRLRSGTRARFSSKSRIELLHGAVYVDSGSAAHQSGVEISTPFGSVFDVGTQFEVRVGEADETLRIRVRSGSVSLVREQGQYSASVGEELLVQQDGSVSRGSYEPFGSDWEWILNAAPALDIEGLPLADFLDWAAAETGLEVQYEDQVLAGSASTIELHGTIDGLRPDEAVVAVLPGTGLGHRIEAGILFVSRLPAGGGGV
jgi:hypothetical protein